MLKGTLDDFTLPDIFRLLSQSNKTGRLEVQRSAGHGNVYFRSGDVYFAESTLSRELIGQKLVKSKVLTDGQLIKALDEQAESGGRLGEVLRNAGLVSDEQLEAALRSQVEDAVFDLLRWDAGEFDWAPNEETEAEVRLSVSVENLIMEGARRLDELAIITRKIPSENAVVAMAPTPPEGAAEINITPDEWRVLVLVNGQRTVLDIAEQVKADVFATMRTLYGLAATGLIHVPGFEPEEDEEPPELPTESAFDTPAPEPEPAVAPEAAAEPAAMEPEPIVEPIVEPVTEAPAEETATVESDSAYHASAYDPDMVTADDSISEDFLSAPSADADTQASETVEATDLPTSDWFDAPEPGDIMVEEPSEDVTTGAEEGLTEEVGGSDPFAAEILAPEASTEEEAPADEAEVAHTSEPEEEGEQVVDKRAAVQELSDLFRQSEVENSPTFLVPEVTLDSEEEEQSKNDFEIKEPEEKHRVEDDEEITRGLISRLIDGVKGL